MVGGYVNYADDQATLNRLDWNTIFLDNYDDFIDQTKMMLDREDLSIDCGSFRMYYIRDLLNEPQGSMTVSFINGAWTYDQFLPFKR